MPSLYRHLSAPRIPKFNHRPDPRLGIHPRPRTLDTRRDAPGGGDRAWRVEGTPPGVRHPYFSFRFGRCSGGILPAIGTTMFVPGVQATSRPST